MPDWSTLLVFGLAKRQKETDLPPFVPTNETSERIVLRGPQELAFQLHTDAVTDFFRNRASVL